MKVNWKSFKKDKWFFFKYFGMQMSTSIFLVFIAYLYSRDMNFSIEITPSLIFITPLSILLGIQLPAMLHNAVHFNIKPRFLNEILGEVGGFLVLFGLGPFRISHFLHHAYADSHQDPHPPNGKGFLYFLATTQLNTIKVIRNEYLNIHGRSLQTHSILFTEMLFYYVSLVARIMFLFMILGPNFFIFLYLPAYITNVIVFAHINFATHVTLSDGTVKIINLDSTWFHKFENFVGSGVYYHKNHHDRPFLYNPKSGMKYPAQYNLNNLKSN